MSQLPQRTTVILLGDFNGRTGRHSPPTCSASIGPYSPQYENSNGQQLRHFLDAFNLTAINTWYSTSASATYHSPAGPGSRVDYICVQQSRRSLVQRASLWHRAGRNLQVIRTAKPRDHSPLFPRLQIDVQREQQQTAARNHWDYDAFANPSTFATFCADLEAWRNAPEAQQAVDHSISHGTPDSTWDLINGNILAVAKRHFISKPDTPSTGFLTEYIRELHHLAQQAFEKLRETRPLPAHAFRDPQQYNTLQQLFDAWTRTFRLDLADRKYKSRVKADRITWLDQLAHQMTIADEHGDQRQRWMLARKLAASILGPRKRLYGICSADNVTMEEWQEYLSQPGKLGGCLATPFAEVLVQQATRLLRISRRNCGARVSPPKFPSIIVELDRLRVGSGALQGDGIAGYICNQVYAPIIKRLIELTAAVHYTDMFVVRDWFTGKDVNVAVIVYADDVAMTILADDALNLVQKVSHLNSLFDRILSADGLATNHLKQQIMAMFFGTGAQKQLWEIYNISNPNNCVPAVPYLGYSLYRNLKADVEMRERIAAATVAWRSMIKFWSNSSVSLTARLQIFKAIVQPVLFSGQEVANYTPSQLHFLEMRLLHAAAVRTVLIPAESSYVKAAKAALKTYDDQVKLRGGGQSLLPPHVWAHRALLQTAAADPAVQPQLRDLLSTMHIASTTAEFDLTTLIEVCKVSKTYKADTSRIELAATNTGQALVELLVQQLRLAGAQECPGTGPRLPLERALAA
ncbi:unnamed protein product, partial [Polarella glacialis]